MIPMTPGRQRQTSSPQLAYRTLSRMIAMAVRVRASQCGGLIRQRHFPGNACVLPTRSASFEVAHFVQRCSGWHMLAQPACVAQPLETCRATSHVIGGNSASGKLKMSFRSLPRHSLPERQAVPPELQTEHSSANIATSKIASETSRLTDCLARASRLVRILQVRM